MWLMAIWAAHWIVPNTASLLQPLRSGGDCSDFTLDFSHISPRILLYFLKGNCLISNHVISSRVLKTSDMESPPDSISLVHVLMMHDIKVLSVARFKITQYPFHYSHKFRFCLRLTSFGMESSKRSSRLAFHCMMICFRCSKSWKIDLNFYQGFIYVCICLNKIFQYSWISWAHQ